MKETIKMKIEELLSKEYACSPAELNGKQTVYSVHPGAEPHVLKLLAYRNCVVVCASKGLHEKVQRLLQGKSRDEMFEIPLVYGQTIHYVPGDGDASGRFTAQPDSPCEFLFGEEIRSLNGLSGFENALAFDAAGSTPIKAVCIARDQHGIIGIAGAAESAVDGVWEMGVDVVERCRNAGLATRLAGGLTRELLKRGIVPFYSASVTNIGSQMVANRCGYIPYWVDTFGTILDGSSVYQPMAQSLLSGFAADYE